MSKQHGKRLICPQCPRSFENQAQLTQHQRDTAHSNAAKQPAPSGRIMCSHCSRSFENQAQLLQHQRDARHLNSPQRAQSVQTGKPSMCSYCSRSFENQVQLLQHQRDSHSNIAKPTPLVPSGKHTVCSQCTRSFENQTQLLQHQRDMGHSNTAKQPTSLVQSGKQILCSQCSRCFENQDHLLQHQRDTGHPFIIKQTAPSAHKKILCSKCTRSFDNQDQLLQHQRDTGHPHAEKQQSAQVQVGKPLICSQCSRSFENEHHLQQHQRDKGHFNDEKQKSPAMPSQKHFVCSQCSHSFDNQEQLRQHEKDKGHSTSNMSGAPAEAHLKQQQQVPLPSKPNQTVRPKTQTNEMSNRPSVSAHGLFPCHERCGKLFQTKEELMKHRKSVKDKYKDHRCIACTKSFDSEETLQQHITSKFHNVKGSTMKAPNAYLNLLLKQLVVDKEDKKQSKGIQKDIVTKIMENVRSQQGGEIYSADVRKAGSSAVKAKIGKADEFDLNIPMHIKVEGIRTQGTLPYSYHERIPKGKKDGASVKNMKAELVLQDGKDVNIPPGQVSVKVNAQTTPIYLTHNGDLIPFKVQQDLYRKIATAIDKLHMKQNVDLSKTAHGPALTLTIRQTTGHIISVDLTPTVPCEHLSITGYGWPRPRTQQALDKKQTDEIVFSGMHLVPKGYELWYISYSKGETALMEKIDTGNKCSRNSMKVIKRLNQICRSGSTSGLPGISSYIFKQQLFWSNEKYTSPGYWHQSNFATCVVDMLQDLETALRGGSLPNYFNASENVLANKERSALNELADFFRKERMIIMHL